MNLSSAEIPKNPWRTESEYLVWESVRSDRSISVRQLTMLAIKKEVLQSSSGDPQKAEEVGGLLLGRFEHGEVTIDDFEPILCSHQIDRAYHLSSSDRDGLVETLQWINDGSVPGLSVVGFYRSHVRYGMFFGEEDHKLLARYFPSAGNVFLLLKPGADEVICSVYFWNDGQLVAAQDPEGSDPKPIVISADPLPVPETVRQPLPQASVLRSFDRPRRRASWIVPSARAACLILVSGFVYSALESGNRPQGKVQSLPVMTKRVPPSPAVRARKSAPAPPVTSKPSPFPEQTESEDLVPDQIMHIKAEPEPQGVDDHEETLPEDPAVTAQVRATLASWAEALKTGEENAYVSFYATRLSTYFTRHDVSRDEVRKSVEDSLMKYGRFVVCDLSNIKVTPLGPDSAAAVFRKSWAASGGKRFAGEELERCLLSRDGSRWKITSEQELKLYWVRKEH